MAYLNWDLAIGCFIYGLLTGAYGVVMAILVLGAMPTPFEWLKLMATGMAGFVLGIFTYMRDPGAAWKQSPGGGKL